jgi:hypothetical protein
MMIKTKGMVKRIALLIPLLLVVAACAACQAGGSVSQGDTVESGDVLERGADTGSLSLFSNGRCGVNAINGDAESYAIINNTILFSKFAPLDIVLRAELDDVSGMSSIEHMEHAGELSLLSIVLHFDELMYEAINWRFFPEQIGEENPVGFGCATIGMKMNPNAGEDADPSEMIGSMTAVIDGVEPGQETLKKLVDFLGNIAVAMGQEQSGLAEVAGQPECYSVTIPEGESSFDAGIVCEHDRYILFAGGNPNVADLSDHLASIQVMKNNIDGVSNTSASASSLAGDTGTFFSGSPLGDLIPAMFVDGNSIGMSEMSIPQIMVVADYDAIAPGAKDMAYSTGADFLTREFDNLYVGFMADLAVHNRVMGVARVYTPTASEESIFGLSKDVLGGEDLWGSYAGYYDIRVRLGLDISTLLPDSMDLNFGKAQIDSDLLEQLLMVEQMIKDNTDTAERL